MGGGGRRDYTALFVEHDIAWDLVDDLLQVPRFQVTNPWTRVNVMVLGNGLPASSRGWEVLGMAY